MKNISQIGSTTTHSLMIHWYYSDGGLQQGPVTEEKIIRLITERGLPAGTLVWNENLLGWVKLSESTLSTHLEKRYAPPQIPVPPPLPDNSSASGDQAPRDSFPKSMPPLPDCELEGSHPQSEMWHYRENDRSLGPIIESEIIRLYSLGKIVGSTPVWNESLPDWVPFSSTKLYPGVPQNGSVNLGFTNPELLEVAKYQKTFYWLIVGGILFGLLAGILAGVLNVPAQASNYVWWTFIIIFEVYYLYVIYKLARAVKSTIPWLYLLLQFSPVLLVAIGISFHGAVYLIPLCVSFFLASQGTKILKRNGLKVGMMGVSSSDMAGLKARQ